MLRKNIFTTIVAVLLLFSTAKTDCMENVMETVTQNINDYVPGSSYIIILALGSALTVSVCLNVIQRIREVNLTNTYKDQLKRLTTNNTHYRARINNWNKKNKNNKVDKKNQDIFDNFSD